MDSRISARALSAALGGWRTREPAYEALADGIRLLCLDNRLAPRTALPAERELAGGAARSAAAPSPRRTAACARPATSRARAARAASRCRCGAATPAATSAADGAIDLQQASPPAWPGLAGVMAEVGRDRGGARRARRATTCSAAPSCARRSPTGTRERGDPDVAERGARDDRCAERDPSRRLGAARPGRPRARSRRRPTRTRPTRSAARERGSSACR